MSFEVRVDLSNPGQFFACCGLFELASRLEPGARARFKDDRFVVTSEVTLASVMDALCRAPMTALEPEDSTASPILLGGPFALRLDWWNDALSRGRDLKVWAGSMECLRIARALQRALAQQNHDENMFDGGCVVFDADNPAKKTEPYYFDSRRAPNAHSRDVGFAPNDLGLTTTAYPAVELLCLVGLQRGRPASDPSNRLICFYSTWSEPLEISMLGGVVCGMVEQLNSQRYRFENWYRTGQKKHKTFRSSTLLGRDK